MKLCKAKKLSKKILNEYSTNNDSMFTGFIGKSNVSKSGKKADNIATGEAKPYKNNQYLTKYEYMFPHLANITQKLKINKPHTVIEVFGLALKELLRLIEIKKPLKIDENGEWILPMGDNIRLIKNGEQYFIKYIGNKKKEKQIKLNTATIKDYDKNLVSSIA